MAARARFPQEKPLGAQGGGVHFVSVERPVPKRNRFCLEKNAYRRHGGQAGASVPGRLVPAKTMMERFARDTAPASAAGTRQTRLLARFDLEVLPGDDDAIALELTPKRERVRFSHFLAVTA